MKIGKTLLPRMAWNNIRRNRSTYFPYVGVSIFAMFTFFSFDLLLKNDIMRTLPKAAYAYVMIYLGLWLLGQIMVLFLLNTNSFLMKRRKRELGLYSILGMEKKHIGVMMSWEGLILYAVVMAAALLLGIIFSRLIFLLLLNLAKMPVNADFSVSFRAVADALVFYALVSVLNLAVNLMQVGKVKPVELLGETAKGEKEVKHVGLLTLLGLCAAGLGYYCAMSAGVDEMIFTNFFLAVMLVVLGTYFLFTAGSVAFLKFLKGRKGYYYKPENFVTVSGMLYRMKKNAASLANICTFSTMVMITATCTVSLGLSTDSIVKAQYPRLLQATFLGEQDTAALQAELEAAARESGVELADYLAEDCVELAAYKEGNSFRRMGEKERRDYANCYRVELMTAADFGRMEGEGVSLGQDEVILFCSGRDFGQGQVTFGAETFLVKEERSQCKVAKKLENRQNVGLGDFGTVYLAVFADGESLDRAAAAFGVSRENGRLLRVSANAEGEGAAVETFFQAVTERFSGREGYAGCEDYRKDVERLESMYGGLTFVGIFFGTIFLVCLMVMMYYKQITEGFEDRRNFEIMQKIGMGEREIRRTIRRQVLLVFALPLVCAALHTAVAMKLVILLMGVIGCYEPTLVTGCAVATCAVYGVLYGICYRRTSRAYYRIVVQMNA